MFALFLEYFGPGLVPRISSLFSSRKFFIKIWTLQGEIGPGNRASPRVNRGYVKRLFKTGNEIPKNSVSKLGKLKKQDMS